jgi:hypothetical protein
MARTRDTMIVVYQRDILKNIVNIARIQTTGHYLEQFSDREELVLLPPREHEDFINMFRKNAERAAGQLLAHLGKTAHLVEKEIK